MKRLIVIIVTLLVAGCSYAEQPAKPVIVSAEYEYLSDNRNESISDAERKAVERAKIKALENEFGVDISNISSSVVHNLNTGDDVQSKSDFYSLGLSSVQGEWIETINEKLSEPTYKNGFLYIKASVKGKARGKSSASIQIESAVLRNGTEAVNKSDVFYSGDNIYLLFKSPVRGYLCVYLVDGEDIAYCLLPDTKNEDGHYKVDANREYVFFSQNHSREPIDEYELTASGSVEQNQIWIVFSPNGFYKAADRYTENNWLDKPMPRSLTYKRFVEWLSKNRVRDNDMVVKMDVIKIFQKD